jgi:hypothetical protein
MNAEHLVQRLRVLGEVGRCDVFTSRELQGGT